jgi:hypothetical protein
MYREFNQQHLKDMFTGQFLTQKAMEVNLHNLPVFIKAMIAESTTVIINGLYEEEIESELGEISA